MKSLTDHMIEYI